MEIVISIDNQPNIIKLDKIWNNKRISDNEKYQKSN